MTNPTTPLPVQEPAGAVEAIMEAARAFAAVHLRCALAETLSRPTIAVLTDEQDKLESIVRSALASLQPVMQAKSEAVAQWTLTSPDGRTFVGDSPMRCAQAELNTRVPASVQVARIWAGVEEARDELTSPLVKRVTDLHDKASMPWKQAGELALSEFGFDDEDLRELIGEYGQCLEYLLNRDEIEDFARHVLIFGPDYLPKAPIAEILAAPQEAVERQPLTPTPQQYRDAHLYLREREADLGAGELDHLLSIFGIGPATQEKPE